MPAHGTPAEAANAQDITRNGHKVKRYGYSNIGRLSLREKKRIAGDKRNAAWRALSPQDQLAELDKRGVAATRQRARIVSE